VPPEGEADNKLKTEMVKKEFILIGQFACNEN
jgi:hypothetical protein